MRTGLSPTRQFHRARIAIIVALVATTIACSGTTEPEQTWANLTLISGDNQTVTMNPTGHLAPFPQLVVVRADSLGTPLAGGDLRVAVRMSGAPGPNGPYPFITGPDGTAAMQLEVSNIPGPVTIDVSYVKCVRWGWFFCDQEKTFATLRLSAIAVR
jgi:hypothetical protein